MTKSCLFKFGNLASLNIKSAHDKPSLQTRRGLAMDLADAAAGHPVSGVPSSQQGGGGEKQQHGVSARGVGRRRNPAKSSGPSAQIGCSARRTASACKRCFSRGVVDGSGDQFDPRVTVVAAVGDFVGAVPCRRRQNRRQSHPLRAIRTYQVRRRKERRRVVRTHGTPHSASINRGDGGFRGDPRLSNRSQIENSESSNADRQ